MGLEALLTTQIIGLQPLIDAKLGGSTGSTDNRVLRSDGTGGVTVQNSGVTIDDSGNISGANEVSCLYLKCNPISTSSGPGVWWSNNYAVAGNFVFVGNRGDFDGESHGFGNNNGGNAAYFRNGAVSITFGSDVIGIGVSNDVQLLRNATGPSAEIRAAGGLLVKNAAGSADAALACGAITASGNINSSATENSFFGNGWTGRIQLSPTTSQYPNIKFDSNSNQTFIQKNPDGTMMLGSSGLQIRLSDTVTPGPLFAGNIAVGISSATSIGSGYGTIHVGGANGGGFRFGSTTAAYAQGLFYSWQNNAIVMGSSSNHRLELTTNNVTRLTIGTDGNTSLSGNLSASAITASATSTLASTNFTGQIRLQSANNTRLAQGGNDGDLQIYRNDASTPGQLLVGEITASGLVNVGTYTFGTLPAAASNAGALAQITDSSVTTNGTIAAGGGSDRAIVFSDGTDWIVAVA